MRRSRAAVYSQAQPQAWRQNLLADSFEFHRATPCWENEDVADYEVRAFAGRDNRAPVSRHAADQRKFGDSFVLITNTNEFLRRVGNATQAFNLSATGGLIEYIDKSTHSGGIGAVPQRQRIPRGSRFLVPT